MEMLARILSDTSCHGIFLDIGLPISHRNVNYNCRVICLDGRILLIRPKMRKFKGKLQILLCVLTCEQIWRMMAVSSRSS